MLEILVEFLQTFIKQRFEPDPDHKCYADIEGHSGYACQVGIERHADHAGTNLKASTLTIALPDSKKDAKSRKVYAIS